MVVREAGPLVKFRSSLRRVGHRWEFYRQTLTSSYSVSILKDCIEYSKELIPISLNGKNKIVVSSLSID